MTFRGLSKVAAPWWSHPNDKNIVGDPGWSRRLGCIGSGIQLFRNCDGLRLSVIPRSDCLRGRERLRSEVEFFVRRREVQRVFLGIVGKEQRLALPSVDQQPDQ